MIQKRRSCALMNSGAQCSVRRNAEEVSAASSLENVRTVCCPKIPKSILLIPSIWSCPEEASCRTYLDPACLILAKWAVPHQSHAALWRAHLAISRHLLRLFPNADEEHVPWIAVLVLCIEEIRDLFSRAYAICWSYSGGEFFFEKNPLAVADGGPSD